ncbi:response regulator, partial [Kaarinaea lacus]
KITGYLEIVTHPTHSLIGIEKELGMPIKISLLDGKIAYKSPQWPKDEDHTQYLIAGHMHHTAAGGHAFAVKILRDVNEYQVRLNRIRFVSTLTAGLITLAVALLMLFFIKKATVNPLQLLGRHIRNIEVDRTNLGQTVKLSGNREVQDLAHGYNAMTRHLKSLYDELEQTNKELKAEVGERERAEIQLKLNRDHLEELVDKRTADLAVARDAAIRASQSKSRFLANMSHELRTPLNAIIGYSEMLLEADTVLDDEETASDVNKILTAGQHLLMVISDILDLSKIEAGKMDLDLGDFKICPFIDDVITTAKPLVEKNHNRLNVSCSKDIGSMYADVTKVRQALLNLVSNAAKFTENGSITVIAKRDTGEDGDWIIFEVSDTGIGLSDDEIARIFQAFSQADASTTRKYGGTGLGLAISSHFCQMMGGNISATGEPGAGSKFTITLPAVAVDRSASLVEESAGDNGEVVDPQMMRLSGQGGLPGTERRHRVSTVLVIDEDPGVCEMTEHMLAKRGYHVISAYDGEHGLQLAYDEQPDVIILDLLLKEMDGWTVLTKIKQDPALQDIPVIVMTIMEDKNIGYALGAIDYLPKPVDVNRLFALVSKCVRYKDIAPVLIIEEDETLRRNIVHLLDEEGWQVVEAKNTADAIAIIERQIPSLIIHDLIMKGMDGYEFLTVLRNNAQWRAIPHITISSMDLNQNDHMRLKDSVAKVLDHAENNCSQTMDEVAEALIRCAGN